MGGLGVRYAILINADYILLDVLCGVADCFEKDNVHVPVGGGDAAILDFPSSSGVSSTGCSGSTGAVTLLLIDAVTSLDVPAPAYSKSSAVFAFRLRACI